MGLTVGGLGFGVQTFEFRVQRRPPSSELSYMFDSEKPNDSPASALGIVEVHHAQGHA